MYGSWVLLTAFCPAFLDANLLIVLAGTLGFQHRISCRGNIHFFRNWFSDQMKCNQCKNEMENTEPRHF